MKRIFLFILFVFILLIGSGLLFIYNLAPVSTDNSIKNLVINQGDGIKTISLQLEKNNLIRSSFVFIATAYFSGLDKHLQAGLFKLSPSLGTTEIITKLSQGGNHDYWLKIIEGQRLAELSIHFDDSLEGYLFPDSYLVPQDYEPSQIYLDIIKKNFDQKIAEAKVNATNTKMSDDKIVILASLLEREGRTLKTKQTIAGILLNRLSINMALQLDATIQYARDSKLATTDYWAPVKKKDLSFKSEFNTYLHPGLPPAPICNPGYDALYAAYHPVDSNYLYYITGTDNQMHYATTLSDHNSNIAKYLK